MSSQASLRSSEFRGHSEVKEAGDSGRKEVTVKDSEAGDTLLVSPDDHIHTLLLVTHNNNNNTNNNVR